MIPLIKQTSPKTCNIACLQMVLSCYGKHVTEEEIISLLPQHSFGNWLPEMAIYLKSLGIETAIYRY
jgi:ABC-type bacteriocin/lantibiotic exporter with double-glycine peptidase domain